MPRVMPRPSPVYYAAVVTLVVAIGVGIGFFTLLTTAQAPTEARFGTTEPRAIGCPEGSGAPACYEVEIVNTGNDLGRAECSIVAAPGTAASLEDGDTAVSLSLLPDERGRVVIRVMPEPDQIAAAPTLACLSAA